MNADFARPAMSPGDGYFFVGGSYREADDGRTFMHGQIYVRYRVPDLVSHRYPLLFIPGGGLTGTCFEGTPDGRAGWMGYFADHGYEVYCVDQVARGRSAYQHEFDGPLHTTDVIDVQRNYTAPALFNSYPQAHLHTQWPGPGVPGDPVFDQFYASIVPSTRDRASAAGMRTAIGALLRQLGPTILVTHSQSTMFAWPVTDDQPGLVAGNVVVEGAQNLVTMLRTGPPDWFGYGPVKAAWGITDLPITYEPAVSDPAELVFELQPVPDAPDLIRCHLQSAPARQLPRLKDVPILDIVGEASFASSREHSLPKYLAQAGVSADFVRLQQVGITGNAHMMMIEKNNLDIAAFLDGWITANVETEANFARLTSMAPYET
jgi:hypothetical protein